MEEIIPVIEYLQKKASKIIHKDISILNPYVNNARTHSKEQVSQIAASIKKFGFTNPVLIDSEDNIIAGHGRVLAATQLKLDQVPCIVLDYLTEAEKKAYIIADNKLALNAGWDEKLLAIELDDLRDQDFDLSLIGFSPDELEVLWDNLETEEEVIEGDSDSVPELAQEAKSKLGDVFLLGNHRLMCGDSTQLSSVEKLLINQKIDLIFTDPPYGINYSSDKYKNNQRGLTNKRNYAGPILNDDKDFDPSFILEFFKSTKEIFIFGFQYYPQKLGRGGIIVWNKKQESEIDNPHGDFELCWSKQERNKMCWLRWGGFNNKEKNETRLHTTQKPIALTEWFLSNWGNASNTVLDLFGGSGSTLIACEKLKRKCFMMELDPLYIDVIVKRWQDFTKKEATLESSGVKFNDL